MKAVFDILRRRSSKEEAYRQKIVFTCCEWNLTVALALRRINAGGFVDENGNKVEPIRWEEGCGQKRCGACAMLINGTPALACDARFKDGDEIWLEPLKKFPVVEDLLVDRGIMMANLKTLRLWAGEGSRVTEREFDNAYEASLCLQCGCCLEACPEFQCGDKFFGAAGFVPNARRLLALPEEERAKLRKDYLKHIYEGCGKSLACRKICPAGIEIENMLVHSNAVAVWRRLQKIRFLRSHRENISHFIEESNRL